jgi:hypothetical protein
LTDFVKWLNRSYDERLIYDDTADTSNVSMIRALYMAQYYRMHGRIEEAATWYMRAAESTASPVQQVAIMPLLPEFLESDGTILLDDFAERIKWHPTTNTNVGAVRFEHGEDEIQITFRNNARERDILGFTYSTNTPFPTAYHNRLAIRIKSEDGAYLSVETVEDGTRYRRLNYFKVMPEWQIIHLPITEDSLHSLTISFTEPENKSYEQAEIAVWLDWVRLELTD